MAARTPGRRWPWGHHGPRGTHLVRGRGDIDEWTSRVADHVFVDRSLLESSRSHRSWCAENSQVQSNERLEFLGDSILQWIVTEWIYGVHPDADEGILSELRKSLVNTDALAQTARSIELGQWLLLGVGEDAAGGRDKPSILADAFEAFIGALYLDAGTDTTRAFVKKCFDHTRINRVERLDEFDARSHLIRVCVREFARPPVVEITAQGAAHEPMFTAQVVIEGEIMGSGRGRTKKAAAQEASKCALELLATRGISTGRA